MHPTLERVKEGFIADKLEAARQRSWESIQAIAARMEPSMLETDARALAEQVLKEKGAERFWHRTHVRFGVNTLKTFSDTSLPGVRLQKNDLFFLDIGPVFDGYEGDAGATFVVGDDPEMARIARDSRVLFDLVRERWMQTGESGEALYHFATAEAEKRGWRFILRGASGHRIADFPHVLYHRGSLKDLDIAPAAQRWILEIQLRHPTRQLGAFYEDLLA